MANTPDPLAASLATTRTGRMHLAFAFEQHLGRLNCGTPTTNGTTYTPITGEGLEAVITALRAADANPGKLCHRCFLRRTRAAYEAARTNAATPQHYEPPQLVVVIPCGYAKLPYPAPAGRLYIGSYHQAARRAANAIAEANPGTRIVILSSKYGLLDLDEVIEPYELEIGQPGSITLPALLEQAKAKGLLYLPAVILAGQRYGEAAAAIWPEATRPLRGARGIGDHRAVFAALAAVPPAEPGADPEPTEPDSTERAQLARLGIY